jgi:hypothetical protein
MARVASEKTVFVRNYFGQHPEAKAAEVIDALVEAGIVKEKGMNRPSLSTAIYAIRKKMEGMPGPALGAVADEWAGKVRNGQPEAFPHGHNAPGKEPSTKDKLLKVWELAEQMPVDEIKKYLDLIQKAQGLG